MTRQELINKIIEQSKTKKWYFIIETFIEDNKQIDVRIKGFEKWLQVFELNQIRHSCNDIKTLKEFKDVINKALDYSLCTGKGNQNEIS